MDSSFSLDDAVTLLLQLEPEDRDDLARAREQLADLAFGNKVGIAVQPLVAKAIKALKPLAAGTAADPTTLPTLANPSNRSRSAPLVAATAAHVTTTTVLWPSEKKVPTVAGRVPGRAARSRRVVRSMAAMWSASRAWRRPRV